MNIMISGGGTGGHIFPAIAIAESLKQRYPDAVIHFVGTRYGMETELVPQAGYPLLTLPIRGFLGKGLKHRLALLWRLPASLILSLWLLLRYRPAIVVGVGGYASGPLLLTASLLRIPTMIQEQNAFPGLTNRLASKVARLALCGFPEAARFFKCPSIVTGNPVRNSFGQSPAWCPERSLLLVVGGSQGSRALNRTLPGLLGRALPEQGAPKVLHQCGKRYLDEVRAAYAETSFEVEVTSFIEDMGQAMDQALMIICRAGASTIAELGYTRVPALLVPFPNAAHDHQTHNALSLAKTGAAKVVHEVDLDHFDAELRLMLQDRRLLSKMASAYPSRGDNAADLCAKIAAGLIEKREVGDLVAEFGTDL